MKIERFDKKKITRTVKTEDDVLIHVRSSLGKFYNITINRYKKIIDVKKEIFILTNIPTDKISLYYRTIDKLTCNDIDYQDGTIGKYFKDNTVLNDFDIESEALFEMSFIR